MNVFEVYYMYFSYMSMSTKKEIQNSEGIDFSKDIAYLPDS